jgi:hypothetical protein
MLKIDQKTLESNCKWKNYLADSRFVPPIDLLTCPSIGATFFRIQDGSKPMSLDTFLSRPQVSQKSISRNETTIT